MIHERTSVNQVGKFILRIVVYNNGSYACLKRRLNEGEKILSQCAH